MNLTVFTVRLMILGLPGIICYFLTQKLIGKTKRTNVEIVLLVFVYSTISYVMVYIIGYSINSFLNKKVNLDVLTILLKEEQQVELSVLVLSIFCGIIFAYILSSLVRYNVLNRVGHKIKSTSRFGDEDVWDYFHNLPDRDRNGGWVIVRDYKYDMSYLGYIDSWSDFGSERELIIINAEVYRNETSQFLYDSKLVYLCRKPEDISIEIPPENAAKLTEFEQLT